MEDCLARWSATFQARREEASAERPRRPDAVRPGLGGRRWAWTPPSLLLVLTIVTGVVDAVSYIALGHVFVANMTGNVVFLGFALAGAPGLSAPASLAALGAFLLGALVGGRIAIRSAEHRGRHLSAASAAATLPVVCAVVVAAIIGQPVSHGGRYALIVPLALAMGIQNATARRLAVPDLTTTVLTLTLTGLAADSRLAGGTGGHPARRLSAVGAMFAGAFVGALLVLKVDIVLPLAIAAALMVLAAVGAQLRSGEDSEWTRSPGSAAAR